MKKLILNDSSSFEKRMDPAVEHILRLVNAKVHSRSAPTFAELVQFTVPAQTKEPFDEANIRGRGKNRSRRQ